MDEVLIKYSNTSSLQFKSTSSSNKDFASFSCLFLVNQISFSPRVRWNNIKIYTKIEIYCQCCTLLMFVGYSLTLCGFLFYCIYKTYFNYSKYLWFSYPRHRLPLAVFGTTFCNFGSSLVNALQLYTCLAFWLFWPERHLWILGI